MDTIILLLTGAAGAAVIKMLDGVLQFYLQRRAKKQDAGEQRKTDTKLQLDAVNAKLDRMQESLDRHIAQDDERAAKQCRMRVLRFNDEVILNRKHTKEHFDEILDDITQYERYCIEHPMYKNNKAVLAIANVIQAYQKCEDENSFLHEAEMDDAKEGA